jgi:predicted O-methyltransferase YrrM
MIRGRRGKALGTIQFLDWVGEMMRDRIRFLEIGSYDGVFVSLLAEDNPKKTFYVIDPFHEGENTAGGYFEYFQHNTEKFSNIVLHKGTNVDSPWRDPMFDMCFIDGDHGYEWTSADLMYAWSVVKPGGFICIHDYITFTEVKRAVDDFVRSRVSLEVTPVHHFIRRSDG